MQQQQQDEEDLIGLNERYRALLVTHQHLEAERAALEMAQGQLATALDALVTTIQNDVLFAPKNVATVAQCAAFKTKLLVRVAEVAAGADEQRTATATCLSRVDQLKANTGTFALFALEGPISRRLPEEAGSTALSAQVPLPPVYLGNPAMDAATNNVADDSPLNDSLVSVAAFS